MARFCIDASAVLAWLIPAQRTRVIEETWSRLLQGEDLISAPPLLYAECTSVLREQVGETLSHEEALETVEDLFSLPVYAPTERRIYTRALELAERFQRKKAYDMQYLAVAELQHAELLTLDRGLFDAASRLGVPVRLLA